jgi:beta-galactosidase
LFNRKIYKDLLQFKRESGILKKGVKMRDKIALKILAISFVLLVVGSCMALCDAVEDSVVASGLSSVNISMGNALSTNVSFSSATIYVPDNYTKIQQAVNAANGGDTLFVREVNESLTIRSKTDSNKTVIHDRCDTSRETINLNRKNWSYEPTNNKNEIPSSWNHELEVPGLVDLAQPKADWEYYDYHWYKRNFTPPHHHDHAFIKIGHSMFGTEVWLNNNSLCNDTSCFVHIGNDTSCFTSQEYDVSNVINYSGENVLVVRVGKNETFIPENERVFTRDFEKESWIPGIWGDVSLVLTGNITIKWVQIIPYLNLTCPNESFAEARINLTNLGTENKNGNLSLQIVEKKSGANASNVNYTQFRLNASETKTIAVNISMPNMTNDTMWSPDNPFLYKLVSSVIVNGTEVDNVNTTFGMREFKIDGAHFTLNGKRIYLRGSNIAFHRFLSDPERGNLPWNDTWIKQVLCDIPKEHNFNYFRIHIGHAYNRWYDVADECGMMLQDEWMFWVGTSGSEEHIEKEFAWWLRDNWNHPSIIIWDCINEPWPYFWYECCDISINGTICYNVTQEMKKIDPTRPWEPVDFLERHPYIYSLNPVLGKKGMLDWIKCKDKPNVNNEDIWFWLDKKGTPTWLTNFILSRWLGQEETTPEERLEHQAFLEDVYKVSPLAKSVELHNKIICKNRNITF